uniref:PLD phosphodiesterase domain-containing protein n=2 Tax=Meloidogyne TaxID=189290 RepID=A0A6V7VVF9_MELEN|nr:unnamed protein product [Meloidogyne enterolobii]
MEKERSNDQKHQNKQTKNSEELSESKNNSQVSTSFAFQQQFTSERREVSVTDSSSFLLFAQIIVCGTLFGIATILLWQLPFSTRFRNRLEPVASMPVQQDELECSRTCRIQLVESIAQNLTFPVEYSQQPALSTFSAWNILINSAKNSLLIAAYKSSLRGKHVLGEQALNNISFQGEKMFEALISAGLDRGIQIKMVENAVAKDKGDNEDGNSLAKRGVLNRRLIVADNKHFYLGSANLDWRSLTHKMEMGVLVQDCPCLSRDLARIFEIYWQASEKKCAKEVQRMIQQMPPAFYNSQKPLAIFDGENNKLDVHLSASPRSLNSPRRSWDLNDIVEAIKNAKTFIFIHVMDYFPMFLYTQKGKYWPPIDNDIREAILRGVKIKIISTALHFPNKGLGFLKSLEVLGERHSGGSVSVKIFKVPADSFAYQPVLQRDRRTHKKFLMTDDTLIIGTSNWSGDYFEDLGTGVAIVLKQTEKRRKIPQIFKQMKNLFERDWNSNYAHLLNFYIKNCLEENEGKESNEICEIEKDPNLLTNFVDINKTTSTQ